MKPMVCFLILTNVRVMIVLVKQVWAVQVAFTITLWTSMIFLRICLATSAFQQDDVHAALLAAAEIFKCKFRLPLRKLSLVWKKKLNSHVMKLVHVVMAMELSPVHRQ